MLRCSDAHTAVYAALGASLAGRRALVALGEAVELPDSRVTGGVAVLMPGAGGNFASLREVFAASESSDAAVALAPDADYAAEADSPEAGRYHKQPERFVADCAREEMCPGCPYRGVYYAAAKLWLRTIGDGGCSLLGGKRPFLALDAAWGRAPPPRPRGLHRRHARVRARHRRRHRRRGAHGGRPAPCWPGRAAHS